MGQAISGIGSAIGSIGKVASPLIGLLPGGNLINAGISGIGALAGMGGGGQQPMQNNLSTGQMAGLGAAGLGTMGLLGGFKPNIGSTSNGATGTGDAFSQYLGGFMQNGSQNQTMMNNTLQSMLNGRPGDPTNLQNYFNAGMGSNGQPSTGMANAIQPINVGFTPPNFTPPPLPNVMQGMGGQANLGQVVNPAANVQALQQMMQHQQASDIANLRERFGNQALGSGAQLAEGNYLAQALPTQALAVDQLTRQNNEQALAQRSQDLQSFLGSRGLDVSQLGLGSQNALSMANMFNNFNTSNSQFGAGLNQQNQTLNNQFALQNQSLGNNFNLGMQGIGTQLQGMQSGAQQNALAQLMAALGHTQGLGTPQAETTVAPSWGSQVLNGAGQIGNIMGAVNQAQNAGPQNSVTPGFDFSQLSSLFGSNQPNIQQTPSSMPMMPPIMPNISTMPMLPPGFQMPQWNMGIGGF